MDAIMELMGKVTDIFTTEHVVIEQMLIDEGVEVINYVNVVDYFVLEYFFRGIIFMLILMGLIDILKGLTFRTSKGGF